MKRSMQIAVLVLTVGATGGLLASGGEKEGSKTLPQVSNEKWRNECSACHMAYHPGLLPERSWKRMMAGLDKHFGENAGLDPAATEEITRFLAAHAADRSTNRRSAKIDASIPPAATPLRITETAYFRRKHDELAVDVWRRPKVASPANCSVCHRSAAKGDFSERNVRIPG